MRQSQGNEKILKLQPLLPFLFVAILLTASPSLLYSAPASTIRITKAIASLCKNKPVILLGEQHKQPRSQKLFIDLVRHYAQQDNKIFVGLEIPADQQKELDVALRGNDTDFSFLYSVIDHPAYRKMIRTLGGMKKNVTVKAIDACESENDREIAMNENIKTVLASGRYDKILVLVGNLHVIKNIKWHEDLIRKDKKYMAGYLTADGVDVCSIAQLFRDGDSGGEGVLVKDGSGRLSELNMEVIGAVNHSSEMTGNGVFDGVVEWR